MSTEKAILVEKMNRKLGDRAVNIQDALAHIEKQGQMLNDFLVPTNKLMFGNPYPGEGLPRMGFAEQAVTLHDNAISQLAGRFGINGRDLKNEYHGSGWQRQVFVDRLQAYADKSPKKNFLIRAVDDQARAVLSDKYKRMNTAAIFLAFLQAAVQAGAKLVDAANGDLRDFLEVIHPEVVEIPTEKNGTIYTVFGAQIRNSDFGAAPLDLRIYQMNVVCLNGMTSTKMIHERHLGSKLESGNGVTFSQETVNAETKSRALQVRDIMKSVYSPEHLTAQRTRIEKAADIELDFQQEVKALPKAGMLEYEIESLEKAFFESDPENGLQGKNTLWKFAQGITHVANTVENVERKRDLQDIASKMMSNFVK